MSFLLDTNIVSAYLKRPASLAHRFRQHAGRLYLPTIVLGELYVGAHRHPHPGLMLRAVETLARDDVVVLDFDTPCAVAFGKVRADRLDEGRALPVADLLIAAVALAHNLTVVTHNTADFAPIPGLRLVDWLSP